MKKLFALAGAVAIIAVALVGRSIIFDDDADGGGGLSIGSDNGRLLCPEDFTEICNSIEGDREIEFESAGRTADRLIAATSADELDGLAWVVPRAWADMVIATRKFEGRPDLFEASDPLASTDVVIAIWKNDLEALGCGAALWSCLADRIGTPIDRSANRLTVGIPDIDSATGLPVAAAQTVVVLDSLSFDRGQLTEPSKLARNQREDPLRDMRGKGPGDLTAVGVVEANAGRFTSNFGSIALQSEDVADLRVDLVVLTVIDESVDDEHLDDIRNAFRNAEWDPPGSGDDGMPAGDLLAVIREEWSK